MTTFVLHGGNTRVPSPDNAAFFGHFTDLVNKDSLKIAMCYWAREKERWQTLYEQDKSHVLTQTTKHVTFVLVQDVSDLYQQLETCDALYVSGGDAAPIEAYLPELQDLKKHLQGKVYLGSSMGAYIVSNNYIDNDSPENIIKPGLGFVPVSTLCHWNAEIQKQEKIDLLKTNDPNARIVTLDEGKCEIFYTTI